jgi:hypothetical protein
LAGAFVGAFALPADAFRSGSAGGAGDVSWRAFVSGPRAGALCGAAPSGEGVLAILAGGEGRTMSGVDAAPPRKGAGGICV